MSAPMTTRLFSSYSRLCLARHYSRRAQRHVRAVLTSDQESEKLSSSHMKKIINPKKNPFSPYDPDDPVQGSLMKSVNERHESIRNQSKANTKHKTTVIKTIEARLPMEKKGVATKATKGKSNVKNNHGSGPQALKDIKSSEVKKDRLLNYTLLDKNDPKIGNLMLKCSSRKMRRIHNEVIVESLLGLRNAIAAGAKLKSIYLSGNNLFQTLVSDSDGLLGKHGADVPIYMIPYTVMRKVLSEEQPEGVLGVFEKPDQVFSSGSRRCLPLTLVCGQMRSPVQLGQLLHQAWVFGCQNVITTKGCADIWSYKALRSAKCAQLHLPVYNDVPWSKVESLLPDGEDVKVYVTHPAYTEEDIKNNILGSPDVAEKIESFNSLELYEDAQEPLDDDDDDENDDDDNIDDEYEEAVDKLLQMNNGKSVQRHNKKNKFGTKVHLSKTDQIINELPEDSAYENHETLKVYHNAPLAVTRCDSLDLSSQSHVVLIVSERGGEMLPQARKLTYDRYGECLRLPTEVSALHETVSTSLLLYEVSKHLRKLNMYCVNE